MRAFGVDRTFAERRIPGMYDVPTLGLNYRMSEMQAALGRSQLSRLGEILQRRRENFESLARALGAIEDVEVIDADTAGAASSHYCLTVRLTGRLRRHRDRVVGSVNESGVGTTVHYPQPVPRMTYYRQKYGYDESSFPGAAAISDETFALPVAPHVAADDIAYMAAAVRSAAEEIVR
jgi:dTDP-4-amino-4,6-dideoxygalactose transaminase